MYNMVTLLKLGLILQDITLILLGAGTASRFKLPPKKQWLWSKDKPIWLKVADDFQLLYGFKDTIIVSSRDDIQSMSNFSSYSFVIGGSSRQSSLRNALESVETPFVLVSDIARCCVDSSVVNRVILAKKNSSCVVPTLKVTDTLYHKNTPINRENAKIIQTPQLSCTKTLKSALATVLSGLPAPGCTTIPGGLLITIRASSSYKISISICWGSICVTSIGAIS
jgi:2-C-methyl-D-erythritol 4-phosphate cytidylyltransferase/2-C-methyl-D-erythritol 2,4-cyclodiphosphate synthase